MCVLCVCACVCGGGVLTKAKTKLTPLAKLVSVVINIFAVIWLFVCDLYIKTENKWIQINYRIVMTKDSRASRNIKQPIYRSFLQLRRNRIIRIGKLGKNTQIGHPVPKLMHFKKSWPNWKPKLNGFFLCLTIDSPSSPWRYIVPLGALQSI